MTNAFRRMFGFLQKVIADPFEGWSWYRFDPKRDMTAFELAMLLKLYTSPIGDTYEYLGHAPDDPLPSYLLRHFTPRSRKEVGL